MNDREQLAVRERLATLQAKALLDPGALPAGWSIEASQLLMTGSRSDVKTMKNDFNNAPAELKKQFYKFADPLCKDFFGTSEYKSGNQTHMGYKLCCEVLDYCSFYKQTWFYCVCGGVGFLLVIVIVVVIVFCSRKGRGRGGRDVEVIESKESIETSNKTEDE